MEMSGWLHANAALSSMERVPSTHYIGAPEPLWTW